MHYLPHKTWHPRGGRFGAASFVLIAVVATALAPSAFGWGPNTEKALVNTASRVISNSGEIPLNKLEEFVVRGASASDAEMAQMIPNALRAPLAAIESEMLLLQSVRGPAVDAYYAYRLGLLGKLVARATAPMVGAPDAYKAQYYADVERNIERVNLRPSQLRTVTPQVYFPRVQSEASRQRDLIVKDYQTGLGFSGVAQAALPVDSSRSISAVLDTWHTIIRSGVVVANLPRSHVREYVVNALGFYIERGNTKPIDAAYARLVELGARTPDVSKRIGDLFFDAEMYERAVAEYRRVLDEDPTRRDVVVRIAEYYVKAGDDALSTGDLDVALASYSEAIATDKLHPSAAAKVLDAERLIADRGTRMAQTDEMMLQAQTLQTEADKEAINRNYAEAIVKLRDAQALFDAVGDEFPDQHRSALANAANVSARITELSQDLINNIGRFSGSDPQLEAQQAAARNLRQQDQALIQSIIGREYDNAAAQLKAEYGKKMESDEL
jgi:tetratricopeptide (TPR) repeat protein